LGEGGGRPQDDLRRDIDLMLEMGATIVRTSHYPRNQAFYDYADRMGLVVYTEVPINGTTSKGTIPPGEDFRNSARDQMRELIRENYNHPSIVVWGLFNEISRNPDTLDLVEDLQILTTEEERLLGNLKTEERPMRRTTAASWNRSYGSLESIVETIGFNRYYGWYERTTAAEGMTREIDPIHAAHPKVPIAISEFGAGANVLQHGEVSLTESESVRENPTHTQWHPENWQTTVHQQWWPTLVARDYLWCKLIWQMFDSASDGRHEGAQKGINDKGLMTSDRSIKKDTYFYYKANWNVPSRKWANEPTLYIAERRWTTRAKSAVKVTVFSNIGAPSLLLNGKKLGEMTSDGFATYTMYIELEIGENTVDVSSTQGERSMSDKVIWIYHPDPAATSSKSSTPCISALINSDNEEKSLH
jgi:beta-galactosidase